MTATPPTERARMAVLADAVATLTEAARLTCPVLEPDPSTTDAAGRPMWVESGRRSPADWAEFVTAALVGAAANVGGIETALAGRPGSWEADAVRGLLTAAVGHDEEHLFEHRTEPLLVQVFVDELLIDLGTWSDYDHATAELDRRYDAIGIPTATTPEAAAQLEPATPDQERQADALADLDDALHAQREQDWADYGDALRASIQAAATRVGLAVPVLVDIDLHTYRPVRPEPAGDLAEQLLREAVEATPLPGNGRAPLDRLTGSHDDAPPAEAP